jgi:hypothetical protein
MAEKSVPAVPVDQVGIPDNHCAVVFELYRELNCFFEDERGIVKPGIEYRRIHRIFGKRHEHKGYTLKSDAEYSFALLLDALLETGEVVEWEYEPKEFWFEGIRRGTVSYKPDFRVFWRAEDCDTYYEVKCGTAIAPKDITKWKRFAARYPEEKLVLVYPKELNPRKRNGKANPMYQRIEDCKKYLHHVWYVGSDYKKFGIPTKFS